MKKTNEKKKSKAYDPKVRHLEDAASFLNETNNIEGDFGETEDMYEMWGMSSKDATVKHRKRKGYIGLIVAVAVVILIIVSIFSILPKVLPGLFEGSNIELFVQKEVNLEFDNSYVVVNDSVASLYKEPNTESGIVAQVLYNEPLKLESRAETANGYINVTTMDGITGYIYASDISSGTDCIEPDLHEYKLIVSDVSKNIMTHASQGTLIKRVMMNTVLYADVKRDGVYQVSLPGGESGWIGSSGVIEIDPRAQIEAVSSRYFVSSALSLVNSTYLDNGISASGISMNGLVYICSCVNGIPMPRTIEEQMQMGTEVAPEYDVVTGELIVENIMPGDILFLRSPFAAETSRVPYEIAICTDTGTLLMVSKARTTIRLSRFLPSSEAASRIITIRRVFSS